MRTREEILKDLEEVVSAKRKFACENDFPLFIDTYLPHLTPVARPEFHKEMMDILMKLVSGDDKVKEDGTQDNRVLFQAPRGFAKTTVCTVMFAIWLACYAKRRDMFLVSATISLAVEQLRKIRSELESNEKVKRDFGDLKSEKWTEEMLILNNGVVIRAKGRGFQIRGFRPDLAILDDLEDEEVIYSKEQRDKTEQWFFRTLLPSLKPDQGLVYVGTKLHQFSLIAKLEEKPEFVKRKYKAITNGVSIWEALWSTERLNKLREQLGTYAFEAEYQNNPISLADQPIKPEFIQGVKIDGGTDLRVISFDPAISEKESSDYRAISVFERLIDKEGKITGFREILTEHGRWGIQEQLNKIVDLFVAYKPDGVVVEEVAYQKVFRPLLIAEGRARNLFIPVFPAQLGTAENKRPRDKMSRLLSVAHLFEQRLVEVHTKDLIEELLSFPHGDYDDMVDSVVYALIWLKDFRSGVAKQREKKEVLIEGKPSYHVEEVKPGVFVAKIGAPSVRRRTNLINLTK